MDRWMACGMYRIFDALCMAGAFLLHTKTRGSCCARACARCLGVSKVCVMSRREARDGSQGLPWSYATRRAPFGLGSVDRKQKEDRAGAHAQVGRWYWTAIVRCGDNPHRVKRRRLPSSLGMVDLAPQPCVFRCSRQGSRWRCDLHTHPCHRQPAAPHARWAGTSGSPEKHTEASPAQSRARPAPPRGVWPGRLQRLRPPPSGLGRLPLASRH